MCSPVKEQPRTFETGFVQSAPALRQSQPVSTPQPPQPAGQPYQQSAQAYITGQQLQPQQQQQQQQQHMQQALQDPAALQRLSSHMHQSQLPDQTYGQSSSTYQNSNAYLGQQGAGNYPVGQFAYVNAQPQFQHQPHGSAADGRKRKAEAIQVLSRSMHSLEACI